MLIDFSASLGPGDPQSWWYEGSVAPSIARGCTAAGCLI